MGQPYLAAQRTTPVLAHPQRPQPVGVVPVQPVAPVVAPPVELEPPSLPQVPLSRTKSDVLAAIESLPPPVEEALPPVETPVAAVQQVQPPVLQPEPTPAVFSATASDLLDQQGAAAPEKTAQIPIEQEPAARPAEPTAPIAVVSRPVEPTPAERPTVPLSEPVTTREPAATLPTPIVKDTTTPITPTPVVRPPTTPEKKSSAGLLIVGLLVVAAVAAALYYFLVMNQPAAPSALGVSVSIAKPEDVARSFPTAAVVKKAEPQTLKIDGAGVVSKVVDENADVQPDTVLVQLDSQVKLNKELTELRDRLNVYQKKLDSPKTKSKPDQLRDAQQKITEKQQRLEVVEGLIKKAQLTAPRPGTVSKVMVKVGQSVTAGTEVVSLADKALAAEIKIPAIEAQGMKVGQDAQLAGAAGPLAVKVSSLRTEGDYAMVSFLLPDNATAKAGDELKLQKAPLSQVVRLPATALVDGGKVFVLRDGKAATLAVTVADREGDAVLLQGLPSGEQVIVAHPSELHEGSAARVATPGTP
jgi:multidrug efflux pump subunit AcrA (membrane-fusion protein)